MYLHKSTIGHIKTYLGVMDIEFLKELRQRKEGEKGHGELTHRAVLCVTFYLPQIFLRN